MLKTEINDLLTQTGPGTPMGDMFRQYWIPALPASELPENDCPPVRVKLMSERLIAIRDSEGRYGLIDEFCAHRGVSLWFGRNEESGLVSTDSGIIMARRKLWRTLEALRDEGIKPPGVDPAHQRVRSVAIVLPADESFAESCREELTVRPGERHASV